MEIHPDPSSALCDGANSIALDEVEGVLKRIIKIRTALT
jgi:2-dehydro-3-deoxyphosphooctonate aldolase (KDO 8-P synthase)